MMDAYSANVGYSVPGIVTGKPLVIGGSAGREEATGRGVALVTREFAKHCGITLSGASVVVQGFGNVGLNAARILAKEFGCRVVGVSDALRGYYDPRGLDIEAIILACPRHGHLPEKWEATELTNQELLTLPCEILIPAAMENTVTSANAHRIEAKMLVEAANGPTTPEADGILLQRGVALVPDILANAGGVTVSYFEWVQGRDEYFWSIDEVNARLERIMVNASNEIWSISQKKRWIGVWQLTLPVLVKWQKPFAPAASTVNHAIADFYIRSSQNVPVTMGRRHIHLAPIPMSKSTFNVAVIGAGAIGLNHIDSFQKHPAARVVAVAEVSPERGQEAVDKYNVPELVTDYKKLLARADIDVVSIALPNYLHAPVGLEALQAGKNVMIDKPIATNAGDAAALVAEAKKQGTLLMVGQNQRMTPQVQTAKQLINRGDLGEVYHAKTAILRRTGIPRIGSWFTQTKFAGGGPCTTSECTRWTAHCI